MKQQLVPTIANIEANYHVLKQFGQGGEGVVYLVKDKVTHRQLTLKVFHDPIHGTSTRGLKTYAESVTENDYGLPVIVSLLGGHDHITGLLYPFTPLYPLHWRLYRHCDWVAQALFSAYCRMQSYLISQCNLALLDTVVSNFLVAKDGKFYFTDFGFGIKSVDHPFIVEQGRLGYGFAMMLLSIFNINIKLKMSVPQSRNRYNPDDLFCRSKELEGIAARHKWVKEILLEVCGCDNSLFWDHTFYKDLGERLRERVPLFSLLKSISHTLYLAKRVRVALRPLG